MLTLKKFFRIFGNTWERLLNNTRRSLYKVAPREWNFFLKKPKESLRIQEEAS